MANLTRARDELFQRAPDECFGSLAQLSEHCRDTKDACHRLREPADQFSPVFEDGQIKMKINGYGAFTLNNWSFGQCCSLAGVAKDTLNRLRPSTAATVLTETLQQRADDDLELQALVFDDRQLRSINGESYKRLWNADLVAVLQEFATDFQPPQPGVTGGTGLYAGEQDLFCFMIDPNGWIEVNDEAFAPGFFVWNSEVGRRTVGVSTFWFQSCCQNHIVWDAIDVVEFTRKHTGKVRESLNQIRDAIQKLVEKRDERKDGFATVVEKAMKQKYGDDAEEVQSLLTKAGFTKALAKKATEKARQKGAFSIFAVVDALTQLARESNFVGLRMDADQKAASLLSLVV